MTTKRAALYARYSTELQSERSIEDQNALCREYCARSGLIVAAEYSDRARSGGSIFGRDGLIELLAASKTGQFDVVVVEALDRLSRDIADLGALHKALTFAGVAILTVHEGEATTVSVGLRGLVGQLFREDGAKKVRRGMQGVVREGRHAGGRAYGYRPVPGQPGVMEIVPHEAAIIARIFQLYGDGTSPRVIAATLNRERVPPPRGARWNGSTINGNRARGHGLLQNPLYRGKLVWNRVRMIRDPETGRRVSRVNPEAEWQIVDVPHLRLIDDDVADGALARKASRSTDPTRPGPKTRRLLSGLLRCGACGGGMSSQGKDRAGTRLRCSTYTESRSCQNGGLYYAEKIEGVVLDGLRSALADPELVQEYVAAYRAERRKVEETARRNRASTERELVETNASIRRLVDALARGVMSEEDVALSMRDLRAERDRLNAALAAAGSDTNVIDLHPAAVLRFRENVEELAAIVSGGDTPSPRLTEVFRQLVEGVEVAPRTRGEPYRVSVTGYLAALIGQGGTSAELSARSMVAEDRLSHFRRRPCASMFGLGRWTAGARRLA